MDSKPITQYINIKDLKFLEKNPRKITNENFEKLKISIKNNPNYFWVRPCLANNITGKNIVYAGNQRLKAAINLGIKEVPCIIETLNDKEEKERTIRDNIEFGVFDYEILAKDWNISELEEWGIVYDWLIEPSNYELSGETKEAPPSMKITFQTLEDLENAKVEIQEVLEKYGKTFVSLSCGEV